jgi:hypothetical protein
VVSIKTIKSKNSELPKKPFIVSEKNLGEAGCIQKDESLETFNKTGTEGRNINKITPPEIEDSFTNLLISSDDIKKIAINTS